MLIIFAKCAWDLLLFSLQFDCYSYFIAQRCAIKLLRISSRFACQICLLFVKIVALFENSPQNSTFKRYFLNVSFVLQSWRFYISDNGHVQGFMDCFVLIHPQIFQYIIWIWITKTVGVSKAVATVSSLQWIYFCFPITHRLISYSGI